MDDATRTTLEGAVGRRIVGVRAPDGWPVLELDDGSTLCFTDSEGIEVFAERSGARRER